MRTAFTLRGAPGWLAALLDWRLIGTPRDPEGVVLRNEERLARMMAFIRLATVPFLLVPLFSWARLIRPWIVLAALAAATVEALWFLGRARRPGGLRDHNALALGDAAFCAVLMLAGSRAGLPGQRNQILTELVPFSLVTSAITAFVAGLRWWAVLLVAALGGTWILAVWPDITQKLVSDVLGFVVWYLAGLAVATLLRGMAAQIAEATAQARDAQAQALEQRRLLDLALHHQQVRDSVHHAVLPIFDGMAKDVRLSPQARRLASRGSLWARSLLDDQQREQAGFDRDVRDGVARFLDLGLLVEHRIYIDSEPPPDVGRVMREAAEEAMANALKYAGPDVAVVLFVESGPGHLIMSVMDSGAGFDPAISPRGLGYRATLAAVESAGGRVDVTTAPGQGTKVSLEWRAPRRPADDRGRPDDR